MFSTAELLRDPCPVCSTRLSPYESKEYGKCIVCFLDAKQAGVKANLERAKSMTAPTVPRATKRVPITVVDPSETLRPVKEYLLDVTVPWEAARDRIILAIIGVNPHIPKVIAARLEQAQFRLNGTNIKKTSEIYRAFVSNTVPIILDLNGSEPEMKSSDVRERSPSPVEVGSTWAWDCATCDSQNSCPSFVSYQDFVRSTVSGTSLKQSVVLPHVKCVACSAIRRWQCGHPSCEALSPLVVTKPGGRIVPWMTCLSCGRYKLHRWTCTSCNTRNGPETSGRTPESCVNCGKASTLLALFDALRDTHSDPATRIDGVPLTLSYSDDPKAAASSKSPTMTFQSSSAFSTPRKSTASASYSGADDEDDEDPSSAALTLRDLFPLASSELLRCEPAVGPLIRLSNLVSDKALKPEIRRKMAQMLKEYTHVRIVRSDGNEFYRAIPFAVIESSIQGNAPGKLYALSDKMIPIAATFSGGPMVAETLQDLNASLCASKDPDGNKDILQELEAHANTSRLFDEGLIRMTRTLTALYIARNSSGSVHGVPYRTLMGDKPLDHYCRDVVLKMGSQSSNVSTHALTKALGVTLRCVIFDRPQDFDLGYVDYPDATSTVKSKAPDVHLLVLSDQVCLLYKHRQAASVTSETKVVPASIPAVLPSPIVSSASKSQVTSSSSKSRVTSTLVSNPSAGRRDSGASTELDMIARRSVSFHHPPVSLPASAASKVSSRAESSRRGTSTTSESSEEEASDESESTEEESTEEESEEESEEDESSDEDTPSPVARPIPPSDSRKVTVMSVPQQVTQAIVPPPLPPQRAFDVARPPQPAAKFMASAAMASGPSAPPVPSTAIRSADAGNARSSVMCGQPVFLTNTACRLQLTVSSGMQPRVMMSDDYNAELDSWVLQLASTPEQDSSSVNIIHRRSGCALTYIAHVLECKYKPDDTLKDGVWTLSAVKSGEGCIRLRHMVTGYYLSTSESKVSMLTVDEAKVAKEAAGWLLSDAE